MVRMLKKNRGMGCASQHFNGMSSQFKRNVAEEFYYRWNEQLMVGGELNKSIFYYISGAVVE